MAAEHPSSRSSSPSTDRGRDRPTPGVLVLIAVGAASAVLGLLPWLVGGMRLPLQNLWATPTAPESMPIVLLPFSQYAVTLVVAVIAVGALLAGAVVRVWRRRADVRVLPVIGGVVAVQVVALAQTASTVGSGLSDRAESMVYLAGLTAGTGFAIVLGIGLVLVAARAPVPVVTVVLGLLAVVVSQWIAGLVVPFGGQAVMTPFAEAVSGIFPWIPAIVLGVALAWCGVRPLTRLVAWVLALGALWVTTAAVTAVSAALGTRILASRPAEMLDYGLGVFAAAVGGAADQARSLGLAVVIGLVGALVVGLVSRQAGRTAASI